MKSIFESLVEYRNIKKGHAIEPYLDMLSFYLIHQYVNEIFAYVLVVGYSLAVIGKAIGLNKLDDDIEAEIKIMKAKRLNEGE